MNELNSYSFFIRPLVSMYLKSLGVELFITRTVHEILWGFKDPLLTKVHALKPDVDEYFGLMWKVRFLIVVLEPRLVLFQCKNLKKALARWLLKVTKTTESRKTVGMLRKSVIGHMLTEHAYTSCL